MTRDDLDDFRKRQERFFFLVGYAISRWAYIDRSLFDFCKFALNTTEHKTAIVFHPSPNIGDHLTLTTALMHATEMKPEHLKHWEQVVRATEKLLPFRNEISHNPPAHVAFRTIVMNRDDPTKSHTSDPKQWWEIRTEPTKLLHQPKNKKRREVKATSESILEHIKKVDRLEHAICALQWELMGRPEGIGPAVPAPVFPANLD
jgi:hypothetical protein